MLDAGCRMLDARCGIGGVRKRDGYGREGTELEKKVEIKVWS
jgi:hypothetical protein